MFEMRLTCNIYAVIYFGIVVTASSCSWLAMDEDGTVREHTSLPVPGAFGSWLSAGNGGIDQCTVVPDGIEWKETLKCVDELAIAR